MHQDQFGEHGNAAGWLLQLCGAALSFLLDHGVGLALMIFGAWVQWETLQLRRAETAARLKALGGGTGGQ